MAATVPLRPDIHRRLKAASLALSRTQTEIANAILARHLPDLTLPTGDEKLQALQNLLTPSN